MQRFSCRAPTGRGGSWGEEGTRRRAELVGQAASGTPLKRAREEGSSAKGLGGGGGSGRRGSRILTTTQTAGGGAGARWELERSARKIRSSCGGVWMEPPLDWRAPRTTPQL